MKSINYIPKHLRDEQWGLTISTVGFQDIAPNTNYPPQVHDKEYLFDVSKGRVLSDYQLVYIVAGEGTFTTATAGTMNVKAGDMYMLFPGEWHTYSPTKQIGWSEYWIGFSGVNIDLRVENGFFSVKSPLYHIGIKESVISLYRNSIDAASEQFPFFQQLLAGYVNHILGLLFVLHQRNKQAESKMIQEARLFMEYSIFKKIKMSDVSDSLNISYTTFRRQFKQHTGVSPAQYFLEMKIHKARAFLTLTDKSIKEIAFDLNFESPEYFAVVFKRIIGKSPTEFRNSLRR